MIGRILILLTTADTIQLKNGKTLPTGYDHFSFVEVADHFLSEGFAFEIATPSGHLPRMDPVCLNHLSASDRDFYMKFHETDATLMMPHDMGSLAEEHLHRYAALFMPGGYAALEQLRADPHTGRIVRHFHTHHKPIGTIGAGAAALIQPEIPWLFMKYHMTCLGDIIESELEKHLLHDDLPYHISYVLEQLGGLTTFGAPLEAHVVVDRELITGQNKYSAYDFAVKFAHMVKAFLKIPQ